MARLTPGALVPAAVVALAAYAWFASPQAVGVLEEAADALEAVHAATIRTEVSSEGSAPWVTTFQVDFDADAMEIESPMPGVARRVIRDGETYDLLEDGTWLHLVEGAPPMFGQDVPAQLRSIDGRVREVGDGRYRITYTQLGGEVEADLFVRRYGFPNHFESRYDISGRRTRLAWTVERIGGRPRAEVPSSFRPVTTDEWMRLVDAAR